MWLGECLHSVCVRAVLVCVAQGVHRIQSCLIPALGLVKSVCHLKKETNAGVTGRGGNGLSGDVGVADCRPVLFQIPSLLGAGTSRDPGLSCSGAGSRARSPGCRVEKWILCKVPS